MVYLFLYAYVADPDSDQRPGDEGVRARVRAQADARGVGDGEARTRSLQRHRRERLDGVSRRRTERAARRAPHQNDQHQRLALPGPVREGDRPMGRASGTLTPTSPTRYSIILRIYSLTI